MTNGERLKEILGGSSDKPIGVCDLCVFKGGGRDCATHTCQDGVQRWLDSEVDE